MNARALRAALGAALAAAMLPATPAAAQRAGADYSRAEGVAELADSCALGSPGLIVACRELALAAMALQQGVGLAATAGSDVPGNPSTQGRRPGSMPRIGLALSASAVRSAMPRVIAGSGTDVSRSAGLNLTALRANAAVGVLNGFQIMPAMGGVFSVDALASYSLVRLPAGAGLTGDGTALGVGARLGLLRESFTLPGISVSAMRSWHQDIRGGPSDQTKPGRVNTGLTTSSLRATAGKNWFVIGVMGGVGWDRYEGEARIATRLGQDEQSDAAGTVASERVSYFVSGWFNFLLTRLSVELGMAEGVTVPFTGRAAEYDPSSASWFASATFRVTL